MAIGALLVSTTARAEPPARDEGTAKLLAYGTTLAGLATMAAAAGAGENAAEVVVLGAGLAGVGPSAGHIYAGEVRRPITFSIARTGVVLVAASGVAMLAASHHAPAAGSPSSDDDLGAIVDAELQTMGTLFLIAGAGAYVALAAADLADIPDAVRRRNARDRDLWRMWRITPSVARRAGGGLVPTVGVSASW